MAIDLIARGLATSLIGEDGKVVNEKMPVVSGTSELTNFSPIGHLTDPSLVEGKTSEELLLMMLYGILSPSLIDPSVKITSNFSVAIANKPIVLEGSILFDRGSISPAYGTSGYRSGEAEKYTINNIDTDRNYLIEITPILGENKIPYTVSYKEGEQPLNSVGQPVNFPLPANTIRSFLIIKGVGALYQNSGENINFEWFEAEDYEGYQAFFPTETQNKKQSFAINSSYTILGVQQFETMTQTWQWIGGSPEDSLTFFDKEVVKGETFGETNNYIIYTNNDFLTGERELRICLK